MRRTLLCVSLLVLLLQQVSCGLEDTDDGPSPSQTCECTDPPDEYQGCSIWACSDHETKVNCAYLCSKVLSIDPLIKDECAIGLDCYKDAACAWVESSNSCE